MNSINLHPARSNCRFFLYTRHNQGLHSASALQSKVPLNDLPLFYFPFRPPEIEANNVQVLDTPAATMTGTHTYSHSRVIHYADHCITMRSVRVHNAKVTYFQFIVL